MYIAAPDIPGVLIYYLFSGRFGPIRLIYIFAIKNSHTKKLKFFIWSESVYIFKYAHLQ